MKIIISLLLRLVIATIPLLAMFYGAENFDYFDYAIVELGFPSWFLANYFTRVLLGSLCGLGFVVLFSGKDGRKFINVYIALVTFLLLLEILQVTVLPLNRVYFGFWELMKWNVWQGPVIWLLVLVSALLARRFDQFKFLHLPTWIRFVILLIGISTPFILNYPPHWAIYGERGMAESKDLLMADSIAIQTSDYIHLMKPEDLRTGKKLVCFASLTCPFCIRAAYKLHVLRTRNPNAQCYLILTGSPEMLEKFEIRTSCQNVPRMLLDAPLFNKITTGGVPKIYLTKQGEITHRLPYWAINDEHVR
jgi:hypothetical protein